MRCEVERQDRLTLAACEPLSSMFVLSPYVWNEDGRFAIALRAVPRSENPAEKIACVYHGTGDDGLHFLMDATPVLVPGPDEADIGGCEDPSIVFERQYRVFYSGYNPVRGESRLLVASGDSMRSLKKNGPVFPDTSYKNTKEATLASVADNSWRLFFEYSDGQRSLIGLATSAALTGPWQYRDFPLQPRPCRWDDWHLSPGPIVQLADRTPVMFYNGGTNKPQWRIGWLELNENCDSIVARSDDYILEPGTITSDATDIAFAASAFIKNGRVHLYYSISDMTLMRAVIAVSP